MCKLPKRSVDWLVVFVFWSRQNQKNPKKYLSSPEILGDTERYVFIKTFFF